MNFHSVFFMQCNVSGVLVFYVFLLNVSRIYPEETFETRLSWGKIDMKRATAGAIFISRIYDALLSYNRVRHFGSKFTLILMDQFL